MGLPSPTVDLATGRTLEKRVPPPMPCQDRALTDPERHSEPHHEPAGGEEGRGVLLRTDTSSSSRGR